MAPMAPMAAQPQWQKPTYHAESEPEKESPPEPHVTHKPYTAPMPYPTPSYSLYGAAKVKHKKVYDPGYPAYPAPAPAMKWKSKCPPVMCDPQYVVRDCYIPREVPVVHPVVTVNRHVIVNVPRHYYQPVTRNVVVDPGCPGTGQRPPGYMG